MPIVQSIFFQMAKKAYLFFWWQSYQISISKTDKINLSIPSYLVPIHFSLDQLYTLGLITNYEVHYDLFRMPNRKWSYPIGHSERNIKMHVRNKITHFNRK